MNDKFKIRLAKILLIYGTLPFNLQLEFIREYLSDIKDIDLLIDKLKKTSH